MRRTLFIASSGLSLLLAACASTPLPKLCVVETPREARVVPTPDDWFALMLHGYDREQRLAPRPTLDCSGSPVVWQEPTKDECREQGPEVQPLPPPEKLTEGDLVMDTLRADTRLVWTLARRFSNGEALGPVALVERTDEGYVVRALGSLRAYPRQSRLRLERAGDVELLIAEGDACTGDVDPVCRRMARVLPLRHGRFFAEAVTSSEGTCLGPAWFPLSREQILALPNGLHRKVEFTSTLSVSKEGLVLDEQVVMQDLDPKQPSMPPRPHRRAQAQRTLQVKGSRLVGSNPSLWVRLVEPELQAGAKPVEAPPQPTQTAKAEP